MDVLSYHNTSTSSVPTVGATRASVSMASNNSLFGTYLPSAGDHARATPYSPSTVPFPQEHYFAQFDIPSSYSTLPLTGDVAKLGIEPLEKPSISALATLGGYSSPYTPQTTNFHHPKALPLLGTDAPQLASTWLGLSSDATSVGPLAFDPTVQLQPAQSNYFFPPWNDDPSSSPFEPSIVPSVPSSSTLSSFSFDNAPSTYADAEAPQHGRDVPTYPTWGV